MYASLRRPAAIVLLLALVALLIVRGIVPALSRLDSDFPSYFTAAKIVADGGDAQRLYDIPWFQEQMRRYRIGELSLGRFSPQPPPTALLLLPLTRLDPLNALRVSTAVSLLCLVGSVVLLARILAWSVLDSAIFVLLSGYAVWNALRLGQPYILVSASCILGYYLYLKDRPWPAGACFGVFAPLKYFPVVFLIYFAFRRQWKLVLAGAGAIAIVTLLSIVILGWKLHAEFLANVLGNHLSGKLFTQGLFSVSHQSFDSLFYSLFVFDPIANPHPWAAVPYLQGASVLITKAAILAIAIATLLKLAGSRAAAATAPSVGIVGILPLLLAPATATYHFILLWLPVGLLIDHFQRERALLCAYFMAGSYALIGFFPYRFTAPFAGRGGLTVFAYPRLLLLLAMFLACVWCLWSAPPVAERSPRPATTMP